MADISKVYDEAVKNGLLDPAVSQDEFKNIMGNAQMRKAYFDFVQEHKRGFYGDDYAKFSSAAERMVGGSPAPSAGGATPAAPAMPAAGGNPRVADYPAPTNVAEYEANRINQQFGGENNLQLGGQVGTERPMEQYSAEGLETRREQILSEAERKKQQRIREQEQWEKEHPFLAALSGISHAGAMQTPSMKEKLEETPTKMFAGKQQEQLREIEDELGRRAGDLYIPQAKETIKQSEDFVAQVRANDKKLSAGQKVNLNRAEYLLTKANEIANAGGRFDDSKAMANWWEGLKNDLDRDVIAGVGLVRDIEINSIVEKVNNGEELTDDESALLNAYFTLATATDARQFDLSTGYQIGQGTAQSVPFMIDMFVTRGAGAGGKYLLLKALKAAKFKDIARVERYLRMADTAGEAGKMSARDIARKASYEGIATPLQTVLMPSAWRQMQQEATQMRLERGENDLSLLDRTRLFTNATKETLTERVGGDMIDWGLGRVFGKMTQPWRLGGKGKYAVNKYIQSPIGETGEEYIGALIDLARSYNPLYDDESNEPLREVAKEMFSWEGLGKTFGTVLPMSLLGGAANMAELRYKTGRMEKAREDIILRMQQAMGMSEEDARQIMAYTESAGTAKEFADRLDIVGNRLMNAYEDMGADVETKDKKGNVSGVVGGLRDELNEYATQASGVNKIVEQFSAEYDKLTDEEKQHAKQLLEQARKENRDRNIRIAAKSISEGEVDALKNRSNNYLYNVSFADGSLQDGDEAYVVGGNVAVTHDDEGKVLFDKAASEDDVVEVRIVHADGTSEVKQVSVGELDLLQEPITAEEYLNERTSMLYGEMVAAADAAEADITPPHTPSPQEGRGSLPAQPQQEVVSVVGYTTDNNGGRVAQLSAPININGTITTIVPESMLDEIMTGDGYTKTEDGVWEREVKQQPQPVEQVQEQPQAEQHPQAEPIGHDERWGNVYQWVLGKAKEAVDFLRKNKSGYLKGVFRREEIGDIDLMWGNDNDKAGLQHIIQRHIVEQDDFNSVDEAVEAIDSTIKEGKIVFNNKNQCTIDNGMYRVAIAKDENGNWVITAYDNSRVKEDKQRNRSTATPLVVPSTERASSSDMAFSYQESNGTISEGKGSENNPNTQANAQKNVPFAENLAVAPRDEHGRVDYGQIEDAEELARVVTAEMEGDKEAAKDYLVMKKKAADNALKKLKHKDDEDSATFLATRKKKQALQSDVNRFNTAITALNSIRTAEEQAAYEAEQARMQAEREARKQTKIGVVPGQFTAGETPASPVEGSNTMAARYAAAQKIDGNTGTITASNGQVLKGHYVLVSADGLTPSHDARNGFDMSDGYPTVDGRSINDRDYKNDPEEQAKVQQIAQQYNGNAIKNMPIVSDEGLVYNGNGRTMAGQLAAQQGTDGAYRQALTDNAAQFGFTAEQVASVPNARVVFQTDERLPYNTTTLALFNATEQQTQSNTAKTAANTRKLTPDAVGHIIDAISGFDNTDAFFTHKKAPFDLINTLIGDGILTDRDKASLIDGDRLSGAGKDTLMGLLFGTAFDEKTIRLLADNAQVQNSVMRALPQILENKGLGEYSLFDRINNAIAAIYDMRENGMSFYEFTRQTDIFGKTASDRYTAFEMLLAEEMMNGGVGAFRDVLTLYNERAKQLAGGQADIFGELTPREDIENAIVEYYKNKRNGQEQQPGQSSTPKQPSDRQGDGETEPAVASAQGGDGRPQEDAQNTNTTYQEQLDSQGNPIDKDGNLIVEELESVYDITDEDFDNPSRNVALPAIPQNIAVALGINDRPIVIKKNIFEKNRDTHEELSPEDSREILVNALYNTNLYGQSKPISRPSYRVAIQTGINKNDVVVIDVYQNKDKVEIVGWRYINEKGLNRLKKQVEREDGQLLILSPSSGSAAALSALPSNGVSLDEGKLAYIKKATLPPASDTAIQGDQLTTPVGENNSVSDKTTDTTETLKGKQDDTALLQNTANGNTLQTASSMPHGGISSKKDDSSSAGKGSEKSANDQTNSKKSAEKVENASENGENAGGKEQEEVENKIFTEDMYEAARRRMHERLNRLNAGLDPEMLSDGLIVAGYHVEKGARKFVDFAKKMIEEFGDTIRPYLKSFYNGLRDMPEAVELSKEMDDYGTVSSFDVNSIGVDDNLEQQEPIKTENMTRAELASEVIKRSKNAKKQKNKGDTQQKGQLGLFEETKDEKNDDKPLSETKKTVSLQPNQVSVQGLFGDLYQKGQAKLSDHIIVGKAGITNTKSDNDGSTEVRNDGRGETNALETRTDRQPADANGALGGSQQPSDERPVGRRVDTSSKPHRVHDGERGGGTAVQPAKQSVNPTGNATSKSEWRNTRNFKARGGERLSPASPRARYDANIAAISLLKQLQEEGRQATSQEMDILSQYSGWGGLGEFFKGEPGTTYYSVRGEKSPYQTIKELLTDEEMEAAQLSRNSAYYTPDGVINSMWKIVERLGFKGGNILEGSAGIGNIFALMPADISHNSNLTAVEIDDITAGILAQLYPEADVHHAGFQEVDIPNNSQDLVITNVPFVTGLRVYDKVEKDLSKRFGNIHDFCIAKNVRKLKQGGLGIFISSSGTLDNSKDLRVWLNGEGETDVIGAFRLNRNTFDGTTATSDIIVVRKRVNGQKDPRAINVLDTKTGRIAEQKQEEVWDSKKSEWVKPEPKPLKLIYNAYFVETPTSMGGEMGFGFEHGDTRWGGTTAGCYPVEHIDQERRLASWVNSIDNSAKLPTYEDIEKGTKVARGTYEEYKGAVPYGSLILNSKGEICKAYHGEAIPVDGINSNKVKGRSKEEVLKDYNAIKEAISSLLKAQETNISDKELKPYLDKLNTAYDNFVSKSGSLNKNTSIAFLRNDVQWASIAAIEKVKETVDINGKKHITVSKTDLFQKRVVGVQALPKAENTRDGIILSMQQFGIIRPDKIAEWLGKTTDEVREEIIETRLGFVNPQTGDIQVRHEYLSGNVREKLAYAEQHNENGELDANIEELRKVIPVDIPAHLIEFNIGSTWIPKELYIDYAREKYDLSNFQLNHVGSAWIANEVWGKNEKNRSAGVYSDMLGIQVYGHELMLAAMNNVPIVVSKTEKKYDGTTETRTDKSASAACSDKISQIKDDFVEWARGKMQQDTELAERIQKQYNDRFNAIVPMLRVDDAFLSEHLPGQNSGKYSLYPHQQQAVARGLTQPLMLAHEVGTGKTISLISTAMEMRRLGTAKKPMIVVQNATTQQFVADAKDLYPNAKILTVNERDRTSEGRREFYAKIKYNDWDLIIVPQSVFDMIPDSESRMQDFINEKIEEKMHAIEAAKEAGVDSKVTKRMKKELEMLKEDLEDNNMSGKRSGKKKEKDAKKAAEQRANAEARAQEMLDRRTDDVEDFDAMDIDALLIDEAHNYKHLGFATMMTRGVKGIDPSYSKRAAALYLKCQSVYERNGHRNVIFATGTPISNTAAEIWTFMKYLMPKSMLKENDIYYFDDFVHNFGKISEQLEFATNGKFKANNRFAQYGNVPELMRLWLSVADCTLTREVGQVNDKVPELEGGKAQDIFLPQSPSLIDIMASVRAELEKYEKMSGKEKKENSHIPLTMYGIAKRAAIDPRLVDSAAVDEPLSKTNRAVDEVMRSLNDSKRYNGTVAIFCDSYQNKQSGFNLFEDIKEKLIKKGVPSNKIAIIRSEMSDTAKQKIFDAVREGDIRVIMGSTQTLGTGVNIQTRLHTLIHMDAPDRPMDYTQRNGRILRQGNMHKEWNIPVRVLRFGVEDSLDVTSYQRLKTKSGFIDSIMNGKSMIDNNLENRVLEDVDEGIFDNPVAMLSGSQYALLKSQAERDLRKWSSREQQYKIDQILISKKTKDNEKKIEYRKQKIENNKKLIELLERTFPNGVVSEYNVNGTICRTKDEVKNSIKELNKDVSEQSDTLRKDPWGNKKNIAYTISLNGIPFQISILLTRKPSLRNGQTVINIEKEVMYSSSITGDDTISSPTKSLDKLVDIIIEDVISGKQAKEENAYSVNYIDRLEKENTLMREREGKPFAHQAELDKARALVDDYTKKMQDELAEKEAKYADQSKNAVNLDKMDSEEDSTDTAEAQYDELDYDSGNLTDAQRLATDAVMQALDNAGIETEVVSDEEANAEVEKQQSDNSARLMLQIMEQGTLEQSSYPISGAKLQKNLETTKEIYRKKQNSRNSAVSDIAKALGARNTGTSNYITIEAKNGKVFTLRISNHNATVSNFDNNGEKNGISIVISRHNNNGIINNGNAHVVEFFYPQIVLNRAEGTPIADIIGALEQTLYSGEYTDPTGLVQVQEVNIPAELLTNHNGKVYGYAKGGKIYLTENGINPNTPIHEYAHLWSKAMRRNNPKGWQSVVERLKGTPMWDDVVNDPNYQALTDDNAIASEVLARYSGKRGAERMENAARQLIDHAETRGEVANAISLIQRVKKALQDFWKWIGTNLFDIQSFRSAEEIADRVLYDLMNGTDIRPREQRNSRAEFDIHPDETLGEYAHRVARAHEQKKLEDAFKKSAWAAALAPNDTKAAQQKANALSDYLTFNFGYEYPLQVIPTTDHLAEQLQALGIDEAFAKETEKTINTFIRAKGFMLNGTIFVLSNRVGSISQAENVFIHERQHVDNAEYDFTEPLIEQISAEEAVEMLRMLKPIAYKAYADMYLGKGIAGHRMLLDELIAYAVSESMRFSPNSPAQYLHKKGITNQKLLNIVENDSRRNRLGQSDPGATSDNRRVRTQGERGGRASSDMRPAYTVERNTTQGISDNLNGYIPLNISEAPTPAPYETRGDYAARFKMWYDQQRTFDEERAYTKAQKEARTKTEYALQYVADRYRPLQKFQEYILAQGGSIRPSEQDADGNLVRTSADAYQDTTLATGRAGYQMQRFASHQLQDMADAIADILSSHALDGIDIRWNNIDTLFADRKDRKNGKLLTPRELIGIYAQAKDCQEAIELGLPDRGAEGFEKNLQDQDSNPISHQEVIRMVENAVPAEKIKTLWDAIHAATQFSLDYQLAKGMIDQETHDRYTRRYYVPERGWRERDLDGRTDAYVEGRDVQLKGNPYNPALKKAHGRESIASDPFAYIQSIAETTIMSAERNSVKQKFLQLLLDNQEIGMQSGSWQIRRAYVVRTTDPAGVEQQVVTYEKPTREEDIITTIVPESMIEQRTRDERLQHRVTVMRDGQQYIIEMQDEALANALNSNFQEAKWLSNSVANVARTGVRYMSAINTQYNPAFAIWNLYRDLQIGLINNLAKEDKAFTARFIKNIAAVQPVIMRYVASDRFKGEENFGNDKELSKYLQEYFESGAQTGFSYMRDINTLGKEFDKLLQAQSMSKKAGKAALGALSIATELSELTVRFAEFATARQMGFTTEEAAAKAKEISVNFDRKGLLGGTFSGLYSFFNATIQGGWNILRGMNNKRARRAYLATAALYMAAGVLNTLLNPDDPDDEVFFSEYDRQTNFIFGKIKLPVTHFFRMFFAAGVNITLFAQNKKTGKKTAQDIVKFTLDEVVPASIVQVHNAWGYNPSTNEYEWDWTQYIQQSAPSVISPIVDVALNRDFKGATVHREPFLSSEKGKVKNVAMEKRNTPSIYHDIAYGLHRLSGGNPDIKTRGYRTDGWIDINPNDLQHLIEGYFGGSGGFFGDLYSTAANAFRGEFDPSTVPVLNRAFRPYQQERSYTQQYWMLKNRVDAYDKWLDDTKKNDRQTYQAETQSELYRTYINANRALQGMRKPSDELPYSEKETKDKTQQLMQLNIQWNKAQ